jgi:hypothetical protein
LAAKWNQLRQGVLFRNSLWVFLGQGLSAVAQAGYFIAIARLLGSLEYGMFVGAAASVAMVSQYGTFGSGLLFLRYVSPDHSRFALYWGNILLSVAGFGSLLVIGLGALSPWLLHGTDARIIVLLAIGDCICSQLTTAIGQVFQAFEKMRYTAILNLLVSVARMLLAFALLLTLHRADALTWAISSLAISLLAATAGCIAVTHHFGWPEFRPKLFLERAKEGFVFAISGSTTSIYNDVDKAMLAHYGLNAANGIHSRGGVSALLPGGRKQGRDGRNRAVGAPTVEPDDAIGRGGRGDDVPDGAGDPVLRREGLCSERRCAALAVPDSSSALLPPGGRRCTGRRRQARRAADLPDGRGRGECSAEPGTDPALHVARRRLGQPGDGRHAGTVRVDRGAVLPAEAAGCGFAGHGGRGGLKFLQLRYFGCLILADSSPRWGTTFLGETSQASTSQASTGDSTWR